MKKTVELIAIIMVVAMSLASCGASGKQPDNKTDGRIKVVTTVFPA